MSGSVRVRADSQGMVCPTVPFERPQVVAIYVVAIGALIMTYTMVVIAGEEHQPHIELAPPPISVAMPPVPVASGAIAPEDPAWRL